MTPPSTQPGTTSAATGIELLMWLVLIAVALMTIVVATILLRRNRARRLDQPESAASDLTDAWTEAGKRAVPIEPDQDLPEDDFGSTPGPNDETRGWE